MLMELLGIVLLHPFVCGIHPLAGACFCIRHLDEANRRQLLITLVVHVNAHHVMPFGGNIQGILVVSAGQKIAQQKNDTPFFGGVVEETQGFPDISTFFPGLEGQQFPDDEQDM